MSVSARLRAMISKCRTRGGYCPCIGTCKAAKEIDEQMSVLERQRAEIDRELRQLDSERRYVSTPRATLKDGFHFDYPDGYWPVAIMDGDSWHLIYRRDDDEDDWIDAEGVWPFNEQFVFADDWRRIGVRVELA